MGKLLFHIGGTCSMYAFVSGINQLIQGNYISGLTWVIINGYVLFRGYPKVWKQLNQLKDND